MISTALTLLVVIILIHLLMQWIGLPADVQRVVYVVLAVIVVLALVLPLVQVLT